MTLIEKITSLQNPRVKKAIRLHTSRGRQMQRRIIVFGEREVTRAMSAGVVFEEIYLHDDAPSELINSVVNKSGAGQIFQLTSEVFSKLAYGDRNEGLIGVAPRPGTDLNSLELPLPESDDGALVVVAQAIEKPGNLGAIVRSADACGVSAILLADTLTDFYHPNSIRSSTAAVFGMPVATGSSEEIMDWLTNNQFNVFTAMLQDSNEFFQNDLSGNVAIVLGNEANGLTQEWNRPEFNAVSLPMLGNADSLNVSVTASVMIYEATRQRKNWSG